LFNKQYWHVKGVLIMETTMLGLGATLGVCLATGIGISIRARLEMYILIMAGFIGLGAMIGAILDWVMR